MAESLGAPITVHFASLDDPKFDPDLSGHYLLDIVTIAICGTICRAVSHCNWPAFTRR